MKKIKKIIGLIFAHILALGIFNGAKRYLKGKNDSKYGAKAVYLYNLTDDKEVLSKNENERIPMASLTKS